MTVIVDGRGYLWRWSRWHQGHLVRFQSRWRSYLHFRVEVRLINFSVLFAYIFTRVKLKLCSPSFQYFGCIEYILGTRSGGGTTSNPLSSSSTMSTIVTTNSSNVVTGSTAIAGSSTEQTGFPSSTNNEEAKSSHVRRRRKVCSTDNAMSKSAR